MLSRLFAYRLAPQRRKPSSYDHRIDGLRGFAAISVIIVHGYGDSESVLAAPNEYIRHLHMSRVAVLLFFILSGYVIGLTNQHDFSRGNALRYLKKRSIRIVPTYLLAILAGWLAFRAVPAGNLLSNLFFLQNDAWGIAPLPGNRPVWSLHYEIVYYLSFLAVWKWCPRLVPLSAILLFATMGDWFVGGPFSLVGGWSAGAIFWLTGLALAWNRPAAGTTPIVPFLLLAFATQHLWPATVLLRGLGFPYAGNSAVWFSDLVFLPSALVIFCAAAQFRFRGLVLLKWTVFLIPAATCVLLLGMGRLWENVAWTLAACAVLAALPLLLFNTEKLSDSLLSFFRPAGKISYALYLMHYPAVAFTIWLYPWNGTSLNYLGGVATWIALSVALASLCELLVQPSIRSLFAVNKKITDKPSSATSPP